MAIIEQHFIISVSQDSDNTQAYDSCVKVSKGLLTIELFAPSRIIEFYVEDIKLILKKIEDTQ